MEHVPQDTCKDRPERLGGRAKMPKPPIATEMRTAAPRLQQRISPRGLHILFIHSIYLFLPICFVQACNLLKIQSEADVAFF
jgi:hypothetical protein